MDTAEVRLAPDRLRAGGWTLVGLVATGLAGFSLTAGRDVLLPAVLVVLCALGTGLVALQLLAPDAWTLEVDATSVRGQVATFAVDRDFADVHAAQVRRRFGEHVLVLEGPDGTTGLWLPIGCDVEAVRALLVGDDLVSAAQQ